MERKKGAKKKGGGRRNRRDDDSDDETMSIRPPELDDGKTDEVNDALGQAKDALEQLTEKRAATRMSALNKLNTLLRREFMLDFVLQSQETLTVYLSSILRKGSSDEVHLASETVQCVAVTLGSQCETMFGSLLGILEPLIKNPAKSSKARSAATAALGMLSFLGCDDQQQQDTTFELLRSIAAQGLKEKTEVGGPELTTAALVAWGLLATTLPEAQLAVETFEKEATNLTALLSSKSLDVRTAAGENIALMYNAYLNQEDTLRDVELKVDLDAIVDELADLATDSTRKNKKNRAKQKATFREILKTMEDGELPLESITVGKNKYDFEGWSQVKRLFALRGALQQGMPVHFAKNELLGDIFQIYIEEGDDENGGLESGELAKKAQQQRRKLNAKASYQGRQKGRANKNTTRAAIFDD